MLLNKAVNAPRAATESRTMTWEETQQWFRAIFFAGNEMSVGIHTAEKLSPVAAAHRILTNSYGMIPFRVYRKDGEARRPVDDAALDAVLSQRPNPNMSPFMVRKVQMSNAFWHGWGAVWNRRDGYGRITERIPLPTECGSIREDRNTGLYWYDFDVNGVQRTFSSYELSFLYFETYDGIHGRGLLNIAREAVASDGMAQCYGKKFYQNGARLSGIVEVDSDAKPEARARIKDQFAAYAGDDAFKVAVLDHGMKYTPLGLSQSDAQFIESRSFSVEEIARFTGVPKPMLQIGKEAYNSNQQQRIIFVTDTLLPYVIQTESEETYKLLIQAQRDEHWYLKGNVSVLLRGDDPTRAAFYEKMVHNTIYNPDECRALEEMDPIPGGLGKHFLVTKNLGGLENVLKGEA